MAVGVPVIASAVGGVPEMIVDGDNGLLTPPNDSRALGTAIHTLANNRDLQTTLARAALLTIKESFSFQQQFADITSVYNRWKAST